jgi:transcription elongation factor GreA
MKATIQKLSSEKKKLEYELRIELPRAIKVALAMGDLKENSEYHAALERQAFVKARISQLGTRISELASVDLSKIPVGKASLGSRLELLDLVTDQEIFYELVIPELADSTKGKISTSSPIGKGLMGRKAGDEVTIKIPSGEKNYEILELRTIHDRE